MRVGPTRPLGKRGIVAVGPAACTTDVGAAPQIRATAVAGDGIRPPRP